MSLDVQDVIYLSSDDSDIDSTPIPIPQSTTPSDLRQNGENTEKRIRLDSLFKSAPSTNRWNQPSEEAPDYTPAASEEGVIDLTEEVPENNESEKKPGFFQRLLQPFQNHDNNNDYQVQAADPQEGANNYYHASDVMNPPMIPQDPYPAAFIDDSDDDIMILDPAEAAKLGKFKEVTFNTHQRLNNFRYPSEVETVDPQVAPPSLFNQPAPVAHFGHDPRATVHADQLRMNQLQQVRAQHLREIQELQVRGQSLSQTMQNDQRNMDAAAARAIRLEKELKTLREDPNNERERLVALEDEAQRLLDAYRGLNQRRKNFTNELRRVHSLLPRLQDVVRKTEVELNRLMSMQSSGQAQHQPQPLQPQGYVGNVYGGRDEVDLKELLNNIRPDEEADTEDMAATPPELAISLLKHQKLGLTWLLRMEESKSKGSILADDMGLGKTIQALSLIVAHKSNDEDCKTTLVVAPVALLRQWAAELDSKLKSSYRFKVAIYHGNEKKQMTRFRALKGFDVVLTSYGTLSSEWKKHYKSALDEALVTRGQNLVPDFDSGGELYDSPFFSREAIFYRVILDEAQNIKNKNAIASKAVYCIKSKYRLCLSGTPIQNNLDELYPILRFLRIKPYNDELRFRADIVVPLKQKGGYTDVFSQRRSMKKLQALLSAVLLRRAKDSLIDGKPILSLPEKHIEEVHVDMDAEEKADYDALELKIQTKAEGLLASAGLTTSILTLLLRLRQACCHSYLVEVGNLKRRAETNPSLFVTESWKKMYAATCEFDEETIKRIKLELSDDINGGDGQEEGIFTCPLCYDVFSRDSITLFPLCGHMICENCVENFFERFEMGDSVIGFRSATCFSCSREIKEKDLIKYEMFHKVHYDGYDEGAIEDLFSPKSRAPEKLTSTDIITRLIEQTNGFTPSTKIEKCIGLVNQIRMKSLEEKIIVFSQFTTLFDLMKLVLDKKGIPFLRYDGSMSLDARNNTIKNFYQGLTQVLLISLRAGNVGLTLTCANHVILMDPFWNPFVEEQAMDRAHRIGQQREVFIHRILINGTIESRIMELQKYKKEMVQNALDENGMKSVSKLGRQELGFLFGLNNLLDRVL